MGTVCFKYLNCVSLGSLARKKKKTSEKKMSKNEVSHSFFLASPFKPNVMENEMNAEDEISSWQHVQVVPYIYCTVTFLQTHSKI